MKIKLLTGLVALLVLPLTIWSQDTTVPIINSSISGKVIDAITKQTLADAVVKIKGTTHEVSTGTQGEFAFKTGQKLPYTLLVSFVGYQTQEYIANSSQVIIALQPASNQLDDVVVVGYGTQRKSSLTGAVTVVNTKAIANRPITNSTQALQGASGVYVNQVKGRPGAEGNTIRIRGVGTLNNNDPLVLVDGVEFPLGDVNPNDIESISVLKDAASSAIYGNRAANGVILVKTKAGQKGKLQLDYNFYAGKQQATFYPTVVTNAIEYMEGKNRALANEGKPAEYSAALIDEYRKGTDPYVYSNTDWFDVMYQNAPIQEHNLRLAGGNEKTAFSLSFGYLDQDGVLLNSNAKRYSVNANINSSILKWLKAGFSYNGTYWDSRESSYTADDGNGEGGIMGLLYRGLPMQVPYAQDGSYADQWVRVPGHNFFRNPLALAYEGFRKNTSFRSLVNIYLEATLPLDIKYKITGAANLLYGNEKYAYPVINLTNPKTGVITPMGNIPARGVKQLANNAVNLTNFHTLSWDKTFDRHELAALAGFSLESFNNSNFNAYNQGYLGNDLTELNAGSTAPAVGGTSEKSRLTSWFGRLHYGFDDKYILEANFRYDGSSRFAEENRWGFFPSFSAAWRINKESFLDNANWLDNLKLRGSWGKLGNQSIPLFSYVDAISLGQNYSFNGTVVGGTAITQISDPSITWETTTLTDVGLDIDVFKNKLSLQFDWFDKTTDDILRQVNVPSQVGNLGGPYKNIGKVSNKGIELALNYRNNIGAFQYNIGGSITYVKNKVEDLKGNIYYNGVTFLKAGSPINSLYGLTTNGLFQTTKEVADHAYEGPLTKPGDVRYNNLNTDTLIDNNDRAIIGNTIPRYTYSFTVGGSYKGVELQVFFQGVEDVDTYANGNLAFPYRNGAGVTPEWLTNSWTPENTGASLPRLTTSSGYPQNFQTSDYWVQDASYLRIKNIQLSYNLPQRWLSAVKITKAKLFVNAQNYFTFTKFKLGDPERNLSQTSLIDYPNYKTITAGVNVSF
ncbi:MAG TPA: TonB-dependent receptor [Phnomibacter sp.]|nr:TonB-dependent receptor [Phnomibacter sp.]